MNLSASVQIRERSPRVDCPAPVMWSRNTLLLSSRNHWNKSIQSRDAVETVSGRICWNLLSFISFIKTTEEAITDSTYKAAIFVLILNYTDTRRKPVAPALYRQTLAVPKPRNEKYKLEPLSPMMLSINIASGVVRLAKQANAESSTSKCRTVNTVQTRVLSPQENFALDLEPSDGRPRPRHCSGSLAFLLLCLLLVSPR